MPNTNISKARYYAVLETGYGREDRQEILVAEDSTMPGIEQAVNIYLMEKDLAFVAVQVYSQDGFEQMLSWEPDEVEEN